MLDRTCKVHEITIEINQFVPFVFWKHPPTEYYRTVSRGFLKIIFLLFCILYPFEGPSCRPLIHATNVDGQRTANMDPQAFHLHA